MQFCRPVLKPDIVFLRNLNFKLVYIIANMLGISHSTLYRKIKESGLF